MELTSHQTVLLYVFAIAAVMGAIANKTNFCTMGAVSDWVNMGDKGRFGAWLFAIAVALTGVLVLEAYGVASVDKTLPPYRTGSFAWLRYLVGGLVFGIGMTLASGCGNKTLVRIGGGNLKSVFVLIVAGIFAYLMTKTNFYAVLFHPWVQATTIDLSASGIRAQDLGTVLNGLGIGMEPEQIRAWLGGALVLALLVIVFRWAPFRNLDNILGGLVIGGGVIAAWYVTGAALGQKWIEDVDWMDSKPLSVGTQSFTFINPMGETVGYTMDPSNMLLITFGVMSVAGVIVGSLLYAVIFRKFRFEWFSSPKDFITHMIGATLMGIGGVLAMGCTIGQGVTGISTLAMGSFMTFGAIVLGSALTMKTQYYKLVYEDEASIAKSLVTALVDLRLLPRGMRKLEAV